MRSSAYKRFFAWMLSRIDDHYGDDINERKRELFSGLAGTVVEIGPGAGANLAFYPAGIRLLGIEPNPYMHDYLMAEAKERGIEVELRPGQAERMEVASGSADALVSTLVLCSVDDLGATMREVLRVLKPGGLFLFVEHVAAPTGSRLRRLQRWIRPLWRLIGDGCRPDRETWRAVEAAGFTDLSYQRFDAQIPLPIVRPHILGHARKPVEPRQAAEGP